MLFGNALSHSCTKLGIRDFVSKFAERIKDYSVILFINDRSKPLVCYVSSRFHNFKFASKII